MKSKGSKYKANSPLGQLYSSLSPALRNKHFEEIKDRVLELGLEVLDLKLTTKEQPDALLELETKLASDFPKVFYGPHSARPLKSARRVVVRQHSEQRSKRGLANKRSRRVVDDDILDLTMEEDSDEEFEPRSFPRVPQRNSIAHHGEVTLQPRIRSRWAYSTSASQAGGSSILSSVPAKRPTMAPKASTSHTSASSSAQVNIGRTDTVQIQYFLKSCSPPLGHLLSQFIDLGFKSVVILDEVACHWTRDERIELLKKLRVPQGGVSELELIVLERRFQKYYMEIWNCM